MELKKIVNPVRYLITIQGDGALLMNKCPDLSAPKSSKKDQSKIDPVEKERLTWREKVYFREDIGVFIPGENIHQCLKDGAKYWGSKIPGEGQKTYTDVISSALVVEDLKLGIDSADDERIVPFGKNCNGNPSKGKKSGCMVYKIRPIIRPWGGSFLMHVFDKRLTPDVLLTVLQYSGTFKGLCEWRPTYGRFEVTGVEEVLNAIRG